MRLDQTRRRLRGRQPLWACGRDVANAEHLEASGLERADRGLAAGAGALHENFDLLETLVDALASSGVSGHLRGERGRLTRTLEAGTTSGLPGNDVPWGSVSETIVLLKEVLMWAWPSGMFFFGLRRPRAGRFGAGMISYYFLPGFFLPATCMRFGPLRVRALVLVF